MVHFDRIQQKLLLFMGVLVLFLSGLLVFQGYRARKGNPADLDKGHVWELGQTGDISLITKEPSQIGPSESPLSSAVIRVYVAGLVRHPGVITLQEGDRVADAITLAGGCLPNADMNRINLARKVKDEEMYYVPAIGEELPIEPATHPSGEIEDGKVNINLADQSKLETLPGIGPAKALKILEYRKEHGSFQSIEEIMNISGIGEKTFANLKEAITIR